MSRLLQCPDAERLRDLLDGMLPDRDQDDLSRHLDHCSRCQQRLDSLTAGEEVWAGAARLGRWRAEAGPALRRIMVTMAEDRSTDTTAEIPPGNNPILSFLAPSLHPGSLGRFGPYEVREILGAGGMGGVLEALDPGLNRVVAIKVLAPQLAASGPARKRFAREAKAAAAVCHEHVVTIHAVDEFRGLPYLVMEHVPGPTLQDRLDREGPLELEEILRMAMQTAEGLAAAHKQGVVHRDIKPGNILLENGVARVKITDFGLARAIDDGTVTQSGFLPGTPAYMAPEQASGEGVDQ